MSVETLVKMEAIAKQHGVKSEVRGGEFYLECSFTQNGIFEVEFLHCHNVETLLALLGY